MSGMERGQSSDKQVKSSQSIKSTLVICKFNVEVTL